MLTSLFKFFTLKLLAIIRFFEKKPLARPFTSNERFLQTHLVPQRDGMSVNHEDQTSAFRLNPPLRVRHIVDVGQQRYGAGRMVISGRMADVCAELERLAACETAMS